MVGAANGGGGQWLAPLAFPPASPRCGVGRPSPVAGGLWLVGLAVAVLGGEAQAPASGASKQGGVRQRGRSRSRLLAWGLWRVGWPAAAATRGRSAGVPFVGDGWWWRVLARVVRGHRSWMGRLVVVAGGGGGRRR